MRRYLRKTCLFLTAFFLAVGVSFWPSPALAFTSLNACAQNPVCAAELARNTGATGAATATAAGGGGVAVLEAPVAVGAAGVGVYALTQLTPEVADQLGNEIRQNICLYQACTAIAYEVTLVPPPFTGDRVRSYSGVADLPPSFDPFFNTSCTAGFPGCSDQVQPDGSRNYFIDGVFVGNGGSARVQGKGYGPGANDNLTQDAINFAVGAAVAAGVPGADQQTQEEGTRIPGAVISADTGELLSPDGYTLPSYSPSPSPEPSPAPGTQPGPDTDAGASPGTGDAPAPGNGSTATGCSSVVSFYAYVTCRLGDTFPFDVVGDFSFSGVVPTCPSFTFYSQTLEFCWIITLLEFARAVGVFGIILWALFTL